MKFDSNGNALQTYNVLGHNDGIRIDPGTGQLWALQNEDANPTLILINPTSGAQSPYTFAPTPHGGGYDDVVFTNGAAYISASNPSKSTNTDPALVTAALSGSSVQLSTVLNGNATALNLATGGATILNLQDPDSLTVSPAGTLVLDSQADSELVFVSPGGTASVLPLSNQVDDTTFVTASTGTLFVTDMSANVIYAIRGSGFSGAYSAANVDQFVGRLNTATGALTPFATGFGDPRGLAFAPVPEPATAGGLGLGLLALAALARWRRHPAPPL